MNRPFFTSRFSRSSAYCLLFLAVLPFLIFWGNFVPGQLVLTSDANLTNFITNHRALHDGWAANWDPLWWLGLPGYVPVFSVENILLWALPPVVYAKLSIPLYLAIGGWSGWALGRTFGFSRFASLVTGLGWELMGSAFTDIPGGHHSRMLMLAVMPLMYIGLWKAVRSGGYCGILLAAGTVAVMIGHAPDSAGLTALTGVAFFIWFGRRRLAEVRFWLQSALGTVLTVVLCAQFFFGILPQFTTGLKANDPALGNIEVDYDRWDWHTQWSFAPEETLELFAPGFFGWKSGGSGMQYWGRVGQSADWHETHQGFRNFRIDNPTLGSAVTALAIVGLIYCLRRRKPPREKILFDSDSAARFFALLGLVTFLISWGRYLPGYRLLFELGLCDYWRNPNKMFFLTSLCLVYLAGYGAHLALRSIRSGLSDAEAAEGKRAVALARKIFFSIAAALGCVGLAMLVFAGDLKMDFADGGWSQAESAEIVSGMIGALFRGAFFWACWGGLTDAALRFGGVSGPRRVATGAAWMALAAAEMWFVGVHYIDYFDYRRMLEPNPMLQPVIEDQRREPSRFKMIVSDELMNGFYFDQIPANRIQSIDIPAVSRPPADYQFFFGQFRDRPIELWEFCNVKHFLARREIAAQLEALAGPGRVEWIADFGIQQAPGGSFGICPLPRDAPGGVYRLLAFRRSLPRALVVPELRFFDSKEDLFDEMKRPTMDLRRTALAFRGSAERLPSGLPPASQTHAAVREYSGKRIVVETRSDRPAVLILNDKYDPGWTATVNGREASIFRANFMMRGVVIPAGNSEVVFSYRKDRRAFFISAAAWAAVLAAGAWMCLRSRASGLDTV